MVDDVHTVGVETAFVLYTEVSWYHGVRIIKEDGLEVASLAVK
jgi:hypothetical protein